ncbi:MAG: CotH kinase family protein [Myxococcota bacterium]
MRVVTVMLALAGLAACHEPDPDLRALDDSATASDTAADDTQVADVADTAVEAESGDSADDGATQVVEPDADATLDDADSAPEVADDALVETEPDTALPPDDTSVDASDDTAPEVVEEVVEDVVPDEPEVVVEPVWTVVVNEVDCRGVPSDWAELVDTGDTAIPLGEVFVTDDASDEAHWQPLGVGTMQPGERIVVDLTAFGVACGQEGVWVVRDNGEVFDHAPAGNDPAGYTYGRLPDISGTFTVTKPTRGAPNLAPDVDPFDPIATVYDPAHVVPTIDLTLDATAYNNLAGDPYTWVAGTFTFTDEAGSTTQPVALRLKGRLGSLRNLDGKAAFKLEFDRFWPGARFRNASAMTLNNMVQDDAKIHEVLAYAFFRAMGVPAPRVGYVWVKVNGNDYGLYADIESYEDPWFDQHYASTKSVFEGQYGDDLFSQAPYTLDLDKGSEAGRLDLANLVAALQTAPSGAGFMAALDAYVDWDEVLADMATEIFIGHWDGYAPTRNNYYFHVDDGGVVSLMAWGTDQTFGSTLGFYDGQGLLLQGCLGDPVCRTAYEDRLLQLADLVDGGTVTGALADVPARIQPYVDVEPREGGGVDVADGLQRAIDFLDARSADVRARVGCRRDLTADLDHDGATCDLDCNEGDPTIYVGAVDTCGDGIDQDCSGRADDAEDCPDCQTHKRGQKSYLFCWKTRTHEAAAAECAAQGGTLVIVNNETENTWLRDESNAAGFGALWLGLDDIATEGSYVWEDGVAMDSRFTNWMGGEPNDWGGGEDCSEMIPGAGDPTWNDIGCDASLSTVCELP